MPPPPKRRCVHPFATRFRSFPPPLILSLLLLAGVIFAGFRLIDREAQRQDAGYTAFRFAENELMRLDAREGLDTICLSLLGEKQDHESVAVFLKQLYDEEIYSYEVFWYIALIHLESGHPEIARQSVSGLPPSDSSFAQCVKSLVEGTPVSPEVRDKLRGSVGSHSYTWWWSRIFRRLDMAKEVPQWEAALQEQSQDIRSTRIATTAFSSLILLFSLAGLPVLWKLMRRGIRGALLPPVAGLPPLIIAITGGWAVSEALRLLVGDVIGPRIVRWLHSLTSGAFTNWTGAFVWGLQVLLSLCLVFLPAWLTARLCYGRWRTAMRYAGARAVDFKQRPVILAALGCLIPLSLLYWLVDQGMKITGVSWSALDMLSRIPPDNAWYNILYGIVFGCIVAPLSEELVFRGFLLESLKRHAGFGVAAAVSSALFAALHYYSWAGFISTFAFGIAMACVMQRTGKLSICILAHALFNLEWSLAAFFP